MIYSSKYQSRHGYADFENSTFKITNKKDDTTVDCKLVKVPPYSFKHIYREQIDEGGGWYSKGDKITEVIKHYSFYLIILDEECLGVIERKEGHPPTQKYAIKDLKGLTQVKEFLKTI